MSDQIRDRRAKLEKIRALGVDPYGWRFPGVDRIADIRAAGERLSIAPGQILEPLPGEREAQGPAARVRKASAEREGEAPAHPSSDRPRYTFRAAGRVMLYRDIGSLIFLTIRDWSGDLQLGLSKKMVQGIAASEPGAEARGHCAQPGAAVPHSQPGAAVPHSPPHVAWQLAKLLDLGDLVGADGVLGRTKTGELTLWVTHLTLLAKCLRPPPEKWHGLTDVEARYRRRYVDLLANPESRAVFVQRARIVHYMRRKLLGRGFIEVDTPVLQPIYGGAAARPFTTHHNKLDMDLYLRISPELYLKRCLVGGLERVFEFSRCFRNEGISPRHNPEFTMLELYQAYGDYSDMMELCELLIGGAAREVIGSYRIATKGSAGVPPAPSEREAQGSAGVPPAPSERETPGSAGVPPAGAEREALASASAAGSQAVRGAAFIDFTPPWPRLRYADAFREHVGMAMDDVAAVRRRARELFGARLITLDESEADDAVVVHALFEHCVEDKLVNPTFVLDWPAPICPLTRRDPRDPRVALRFELFISGMEIANAYTELNDPAVQRETLARQLRGEGDETMAVMDEDFCEALEYGMPPAGGLGIGLDRLVMLLTGSPSIRDVILFPLQRPQKAD